MISLDTRRRVIKSSFINHMNKKFFHHKKICFFNINNLVDAMTQVRHKIKSWMFMIWALGMFADDVYEIEDF